MDDITSQADISPAGDAAARLTWPFVERRKADRRQGERRQARQEDSLLVHTESVCTGRELQIVRLLLKGMTNKQIADKLGIAEGTVKKHLHHVYRKVGVRRRALLIVDLSR